MRVYLFLMVLLSFSLSGCQFWSDSPPTPATTLVQNVVSPISPVTIPISPVETPAEVEAVATLAILTPVADLTETWVKFKAANGIELSGTLFGRGQTLVIILPAPGETEADWANQAKTIAAQGFMVLNSNPATQSNSTGVVDIDKVTAYIKAALQMAQEKGATDHILLGVGENGLVAVKAAAQTKPKAVVLFSTPLSSGDLALTADDLEAITGPKLFIDTEQSPTQAAAVQMFEWSDSPKTWRFLPGAAQGADMYNTDYSQNLTDFVAAFFLLRLKE